MSGLLMISRPDTNELSTAYIFQEGDESFSDE